MSDVANVPSMQPLMRDNHAPTLGSSMGYVLPAQWVSPTALQTKFSWCSDQ